MRTRLAKASRTWMIIGMLALLITWPIAGTGIANAQSELEVSIDVPSTVTAGEQTDISASISAPDLRRDVETNAQVKFYSDGERIASRTVTLGDGETLATDITHTFEETGDKEIRVEVSANLGRLDLNRSVSRTIEVERPDVQLTGPLSVDISPEKSPTVGQEMTVGVESEVPRFTGSQAGTLTLELLVDGDAVAIKTFDSSGGDEVNTDFTTTIDSAGKKQVTVRAVLTVRDITERRSKSAAVRVRRPLKTVSGASFSTPASLEDEVERVRQDVRSDELSGIPNSVKERLSDGQGFVLATQDQLYIVLGQETPDIGTATVQGFILDQEISDEFTFGVIAAADISTGAAPREATVQEVTQNSEEYRLQLVQVTSNYRRASILVDPDKNPTGPSASDDSEAIVTPGVLTEDPLTAQSLFAEIGANTRRISQQSGQEDRVSISQLSDLRQPALRTVSFEEKFWMDNEATVNGIVLSPDSTASRFIKQYNPSSIEYMNDNGPTLYVTETDLDEEQMESVNAIKSQPDALDGQIVQTEMNIVKGQISTQETLEHYSGCQQTNLQIPAPQGTTCVDVRLDTLLHAGVGWDTAPQSRDGVLFVVGANSLEQDEPFAKSDPARYRITGEVVSTSRVSESLPDGSILLIYELSKIGDEADLNRQARAVVETHSREVRTSLYQQLATDNVDIQIEAASNTVQNVESGEPAIVQLQKKTNSPVTLQQAAVNTTSPVQELSVSVAKVPSTNTAIENPPENSFRLLNVSSSTPDKHVESTTLQFRVYNTVLPDEGDLTVYRYHSGQWTALDTRITNRGEVAATVEVTTPGFSYFMLATGSEPSTADQQDSGVSTSSATSQADGQQDISTGGTENMPSETQQSTTEGTTDPDTTSSNAPGFGIILALVAVSLFAKFISRD